MSVTKNRYKVVSITNKTRETYCLKVQKPNYLYRAGQCFSVGVSGSALNREYSIYSSPNDDYLEFLIREIDDGLVSSQLRKLRTGDIVDVDGPYGEFCIHENDFKKDFLFIATGTGIAPFHSFIKTYPQINYKIIHGIRNDNENYDQEHYKNESYISCVSQSKIKSRTKVTDFLKEYEVSKNNKIYLCGNQSMIIDCLNILFDKNVSGDQIFTEVFF